MALKRPNTSEESQVAAAEAQANEVRAQVEEAQVEAQPATTTAEAVSQPHVGEAPKAEVQGNISASSTELAASQPTAIAASQPKELVAHAGPSVEDTLAAAGFGGLILDGLSYDRIKLNNGQFLLGQNDAPLGNTFQGVIEKTVPLYLFRRSDDQQETEILYSYDADGATTTTGEDTSATFAEWAGAGYDKPVKSQYMECIVTVTSCPGNPELEGDMVICQIAPASVRRVSGFFNRQAMKNKLVPSQYITEFRVGAPIKKDRSSYNPWEFSYVGLAEDAGL